MNAHHDPRSADRRKQGAALSSVAAGLSLTSLKVVIGLASGSLGILAEAAHSGLDLVAALMTLLAVRFAARPPDATHPYGHGKIENLSAFFEAGLLLLTTGWVGYEAISRLLHPSIRAVDASLWAFAVMVVSIVVDFGRSRTLKRVAEEYRSQALRADALHFSTDIWSSLVVLAGLAALRVGQWTGWPGPWSQADALAALGVCGVVVFVTIRLLRETIDALLDRAPDVLPEKMAAAVRSVPGVLAATQPRLRRVGSKLFVDLVVHVPRTATFGGAHATTEAVERAIRAAAPDSDLDLVLQLEPDAAPDERPDDTIRHLARESGLRVHDVRVTKVGTDTLEADLHLEVDPTLSLRGSHATAARLEEAVRSAVPGLRALNTHLEVLAPTIERRTEVTEAHPDLVAQVRSIAEHAVRNAGCHQVRVYRSLIQDHHAPQGNHADPFSSYDLVLHISFPADEAMPQVHAQSEEIERHLRQDLPDLAHVLIHAVPNDEQES
jgi:cation diffusion facilitator family transporter